uniref:Alpha-tubulin N-acetyltransferase n=1 Tax=Plectus sambesii TaxID=2011161 RepID=A0A914VWM9_9BILA
MNVPMDLTPILGGTLVRLDSMRVKQLQNLTVYRAIDKLGEMSAKAMQLRSPLTTCEKLMQQPEHSLYLLWERSEDENTSVLIGLLKVGKKTLFLYDTDMTTYHGKVTAVLDFYVHFNRQRHGYGRQLFDFMLHSERLTPEQLALDNPSVTLLAFMTKHFELENAIWQNTNFVVFPQFFRSVKTSATNGAANDHVAEKVNDKMPPEGWGRPGTPHQIGGGATEARWLDHAISGHERRGNAMNNSVHGDITTEGTQANRANQARQRKAHILSSKPLW